jgi:hypothetical protein
MSIKLSYSPGDYCKTTTGQILRVTGGGFGINQLTNKKVRLARKRISIRLIDPKWAMGLADGSGCTVGIYPNNALHFYGPLEALEKIRKVIESTHGFSPRLVLECTVDGEPQPDYPRIEVHPSNVLELP